MAEDDEVCSLCSAALWSQATSRDVKLTRIHAESCLPHFQFSIAPGPGPHDCAASGKTAARCRVHLSFLFQFEPMNVMSSMAEFLWGHGLHVLFGK